MIRDEQKDLSPPRRQAAYGAVKSIAFAFIIIVIFFACLEAALVLIGVQPVALTEDPLVGFSDKQPLFVEAQQKDGTAIMKTAKNKLNRFNYQEFPKPKAPDTYRIFCMGGSTTNGRPYADNSSFCGWLRAFLRVADPSRGWEVINAGGISYASYRVAHLMQELTEYQPDMFIVYSGQNEFLEERSYGRLKELPKWLINADAVLNETRTYTALKSAIKMAAGDARPVPGARDELSGDVDTKLDHTAGPTSYHRDDELKRDILFHYRLNLGRMVKIAHTADAEILFVKPAVNLKDMSPFKSEHKSDLNASQVKTWRKAFSEGREHYKADEHEDALSAYRHALSIDERYAELHYQIGRTYFASGRYGKAKEAFWRAVDEDVAPLRMLSRMGDIIAAVASQHDVPMVDFQQTLSDVYLSHYDHDVFGNEYFIDHVHTDAEGYRLLGLSLFDELETAGVVHPSQAWGKQQIAEVTGKVMASLDDEARAKALVNLGKVLDWAGKFDEALSVFRRQLEVAGPNAKAYYHLAKSSFRNGSPDDAIYYYRKLLEVEPAAGDAHKGLASILKQEGKTDAAIKHYRQALKHGAGDYVTHQRLALLLAKSGETETARRHFRESLRLKPEYEAAALNLMVLEGKAGRHEQALRIGRKMLETNPDRAEIRNMMGVILAQDGRPNEAVHHFEAALKLRPDFSEAEENLQEALEMQES